MLYIGYFRFFEFENPESGPAESRFTFAVEAADVDDACQKMATTLTEQHGELLQNATELYLDDLIEIKSLPDGGVVLRAEQAPYHDDDALVTMTLPNYDGEECLNYRQGTEDQEDEEEYVPQPFIEFEQDA